MMSIYSQSCKDRSAGCHVPANKDHLKYPVEEVAHLSDFRGQT